MERKLIWIVSQKSFFLHGKWKGYNKSLVSTGKKPGVDKIPNQNEYESALMGGEDLGKKIVKLGELNKLALQDLILLINTSSFDGKVEFKLVKNAKSVDFLEENCKVVWNFLVSKYALHTASSLIKLKSEFHNSKLELIDMDLDKWISHLVGLRN